MVTQKDIDELVAEAVRRAKIEMLMLALKISNDAYSHGSFRVAVHGHIMKLTAPQSPRR